MCINLSSEQGGGVGGVDVDKGLQWRTDVEDTDCDKSGTKK